MILKEYFNFEKNINNKILKIQIFEFPPGKEIQFDYQIFSSFYVLLNIGHIIKYEIDGSMLFCPAKNGLIGIKNQPLFFFNKHHYYKFSIITLKNNMLEEILKKIELNLKDYIKHILKNRNFTFNFSLNIEMIKLIESIYKLSNSLKEEIYYIELEAYLLLFLVSILKEIFYENFRYNKLSATPDLRYIYCLKLFFENNNIEFSNILKNYDFDNLFLQKIHSKHSSEDITKFLTNNKK